MTRADVFAVVTEQILDVLPDLDPALIREDQSLRDLGANSIDRADVIVQTMERLGVKFPIAELAGVSNLRGLVDVLVGKVS